MAAMVSMNIMKTHHILNSAIFILLAFSFAKPQTMTDWRTLGAFSAFIAMANYPNINHVSYFGRGICATCQ